MKYLIAEILILSMFASCKTSQKHETTVIYDTLYIYKHDTSFVNSLMKKQIDSMQNKVNGMLKFCDSILPVVQNLKSQNFELNFKLQRIWYYDSLCLINSRNDKFLKGWIRRALEK